MTVDTTVKAQTRTELRPGWRVVRFGDVVRDVKVTVDAEESGLERYIAGEHMDTDDLHIRRWGTIGDGYLGPAFHRKFVAGQVLYGSRRTYLRKVAVADFDGICANTTFVLEPLNDDLIPELLPFVMQTEGFVKHSMQQSRGSTNPYVTFKDLAWYEFALPPRDEQRRIAEILWAADEAVEKLIDTLAQLQVASAAITINLLQQDSKSMQVELGDVADVSYGLTVNASRRNMVDERPYLRVANVHRGKLDLSEIKTIGCNEDDIVRFGLQEGDILVVEGHADVNEIGRTAIWTSEVTGCLHQNHILRVRCGPRLRPKFLGAYLNSTKGKKYFKQHAKSTSGLNTINSTVLRQIPISLPDVAYQDNVIGQLQTLEKNKSYMERHLLYLQQLKAQLLAELL